MKRKFFSWDECMALREVRSLRKLTHPQVGLGCRAPGGRWPLCWRAALPAWMQGGQAGYSTS